MDEYPVDILPGEVIPWVRAAARSAVPAFTVRASSEYRVEQDYDRADYGIGEGDDLSLVMLTGRMTMTPAGDGAGNGEGWSLELRARDSVGLLPAGEDGQADDPDMSVEAFVERFLVPEQGEVEIVLLAETPHAAEAFQRWLISQRRG